MKSPHKILTLVILFFFWGRAGALNVFECVSALLPITGPAAFQVKRQGLERPFSIADKYLVFPEVRTGSLNGLFIYTEKRARYFDAAQLPTGGAPPMRLSSLEVDEGKILKLVAQVDGLETVTVPYAPDLRTAKQVYRDPAQIDIEHREQKLLRLASLNPKAGEALLSPLRTELELRKIWIQTHNLDEEAFRKLSLAMQGPCRE